MEHDVRAEEADLLYGVPAIADYLKLAAKVVYNLHDRGTIPTFKIGGKVCARRSTLAAYFAEQEAAARHTANRA